MYADLVWNHNGFADSGDPGFVEAGDYPGFTMSLDDAVDGDFHSGFATGVNEGRLSNLVDIDHETDFRFIRNPVDPNDPRNIPAGTTPTFGRVADVPTEANRRFYPSQNGQSRTLFDPATNETVTVYDFRGDGSEAADGTPVLENATGYLMRNAQWYVQDVGFDGFRLDAVKHFEPWVLNYLDRAVYGANPRKLLDGSTDHVFSFGEALDGSSDLLQQYTRKDIDPSQPDRVGGNRDVLDFPLHFALKGNLTSNGLANDWRNITQASFDRNDDGLANNGSQGVAFDASHDDFGADLGNVANAYLSMRPGNWVVYFNAKQFGDGRDFPRDGRGDALGGLYGDAVMTLVQARATHGRGNYVERWIDKETLVYERESSAIVGLSNRTDGGFDERWVDTGFAPGTRLIELSGNAEDATVDPNDDVPSVVRVRSNGQVPVRVPRNAGHGNGYVIYGLPTPVGTMTIEGAAGTIAGGTPTEATNGTTRLADYTVVTADSVVVALDTQPVTLADGYRDFAADGDNALLKVNAGLDVNGNGVVDNVTPTPGSVAYGFETFADVSNPLALGGDGRFRQSLDTTRLPEGVNYVEARAFRQRDDGGPAVFSTFKEVLYVDRLPPESGVSEVVPFDTRGRDFLIESIDGTADSVHAFLNLPATTDPLSLVDGNNRASRVDRDLFKYGFGGLVNGNNVLTVVTYEITGNVNVQRFGGYSFETGVGLGVGDLNASGGFGLGDVANTGYSFESILYARGDRFHPAGDADADGDVDTLDLFLLEPIYLAAGATTAAEAARAAELRRGNVNEFGGTDAFDLDALFERLGSDDWFADLDADGLVTQDDADVLLGEVFETVRGDANLDGVVNLADFGVLRASFGDAAGWAAGDFTGDGVVNLADFGLLRSNFGFDRDAGLAAGSLIFPADLAATVPEPAAAGVIVLGGIFCLRRRRGPLPAASRRTTGPRHAGGGALS